jgi:hypothetical protein
LLVAPLRSTFKKKIPKKFANKKVNLHPKNHIWSKQMTFRAQKPKSIVVVMLKNIPETEISIWENSENMTFEFSRQNSVLPKSLKRKQTK